MKSGEWHDKLEEVRAEKIPSKTFQNWRTTLADEGLIEEVRPGSHIYRATAQGHDLCAARANGVPFNAPDQPKDLPAMPHPRKGVAGGAGQAEPQSTSVTVDEMTGEKEADSSRPPSSTPRMLQQRMRDRPKGKRFLTIDDLSALGQEDGSDGE